jgi:hypothetical protein
MAHYFARKPPTIFWPGDIPRLLRNVQIKCHDLGALKERVDAAPKARGGISGGQPQQCPAGVAGDFAGGTGKAEAPKPPGAGIVPKLCP